jgi:hypothetical protein
MYDVTTVVQHIMNNVMANATTSSIRQSYTNVVSNNNWSNQQMSNLVAFTHDAAEYLAATKGGDPTAVLIEAVEFSISIDISRYILSTQQYANYTPDLIYGANNNIARANQLINGIMAWKQRGSPVYNQMSNQMGNPMNNQFVNQMGNQFGNQFGNNYLVPNQTTIGSPFGNQQRNMQSNTQIVNNGRAPATKSTFNTPNSTGTFSTIDKPVTIETPVVEETIENVVSIKNEEQLMANRNDHFISLGGVPYPMDILNTRDPVSTAEVIKEDIFTPEVLSIDMYDKVMLDCSLDLALLRNKIRLQESSSKVVSTNFILARPVAMPAKVVKAIEPINGDTCSEIVIKLLKLPIADDDVNSFMELDQILTKEVNLNLRGTLNLNVTISSVLEDYPELLGVIKSKVPEKYTAFKELDGLLSAMMVTIPGMEKEYADSLGIDSDNIGFVVSNITVVSIPYSKTTNLVTDGVTIVHHAKTPWLYDICEAACKENFICYLTIGNNVYRIFKSLIAKNSYSILKV